ncbi:MAG: endonuclease/exonuclease/phosphatase, partial [Gemmatimonadetes bacterium]|nr:endonuclease/exonuclease/phosphatase [Gemmatimonadota bacterium]
MPYYASLNPTRADDRRTAEGLLRLRIALGTDVPAKSIDDTLLIASWNLREFGGTKFGGREREALFYIAEVISHFDLVAVQEVRDNLDALDNLMRLLGGWWDYLVTDVTVGRQGNGERLAFIYDKRKVNFGGLAGEITSAMVKSGDTLSIPRAF